MHQPQACDRACWSVRSPQCSSSVVHRISSELICFDGAWITSETCSFLLTICSWSTPGEVTTITRFSSESHTIPQLCHLHGKNKRRPKERIRCNEMSCEWSFFCLFVFHFSKFAKFIQVLFQELSEIVPINLIKVEKYFQLDIRSVTCSWSTNMAIVLTSVLISLKKKTRSWIHPTT